ncbi:MAG TPA: hypothetical protein VFG30_38615 [Polyangiales bacterium]|nr:hypothetical protein [Polyangiales bacterium]
MFVRSIGIIVATSIAFGCAADETQSSIGDPTVVVKPPVGGSAFSGSAGSAVTPVTNPSQAGSGVGVGQPSAPPSGPAAPTGVAGAPAAPGVIPPITTPAPPASAGSGCKANAPCSHGTEPVIPQPIGECPKMVTGAFRFMDVTSQIWVGNKSESQKGPIMLYWHGTGGTAITATAELDPTLVQEIMGMGGVIGSIEGGLKGDTLDWGVFTTGDYQSADQIVACAVQQLNIDTKRIYASGASAGGLAAGEIAYGRSSYVAATLPNSGGQGGYPMNMILQDPTHVPAAMTMHGARGRDVVVIDFGDSSLREDIDIAKKGGFAVDCDHGGSHVAAPPSLKAVGWDFLKKHPFGFGTSPYAGGLPSTYPSYCQIVTKDTPMPVVTNTGAGAMAPRP